MITYALESWSDYYRDCQDLWREHYEEIAQLKHLKAMSPDVSLFQFLDAQGALQILTARQAGRMVGYCLVLVRRHTHYATLCGFEDSYFISAAARRDGKGLGGSPGLRLILLSLQHLRKRGVQEVFFMTKTHKDLGSLFRKLGFTHSDEVYSKWIGPQGQET